MRISKLSSYPDWLRWIIALPAAVGSVFAVSFMVNLAYNMGIYSLNPNAVWSGIIMQQGFISVFLEVLYIVVPKYELRVLFISSILLALMVILAICSNIIYYNEYTGNQFFIDIATNILSLIVIVYINFANNSKE